MNETTGINRLASETSPYLLQHKENPVHWWPWGPEALSAAQLAGKPILLSVGYAACHWCHVMAHESFEDPKTAEVMNELFVCIKVDREERPDIDAIYMAALLRLNDQGGWPLTMFLDAKGHPFWGGTYFPPEPRFGRPSFVQILQEIARIFREEPDKIRHNATRIVQAITPQTIPSVGFAADPATMTDLAAKAVSVMDPDHGGIRGAPKFPQWGIFWFLWRIGIAFDNQPARTAVTTFLTHVCQGGIYDHIGGGFARYSTDDRWLVPHFEKMLYDNALLIDLLTEVWRETSNPLFASRISETIDWLAREMVTMDGGFAASLDADSEGHEGKFYVWTPDQITQVLGDEEGQYFCSVYDVTRTGNFEGRSIPNRLGTIAFLSPAEEAHLAELRTRLLANRATRVRPGWDDKILADWNGLAIAALARAAFVFDRPDWHRLAERAFSFVRNRMEANGRLMHSWRNGVLKAPATSADYANMIRAAIRLYELSPAPEFLNCAETWTEILDRHYWMPETGGYATSADDTTDIIVRLRNAQDDATPNPNAIMAANLTELFLLTGDTRYLNRASATVKAFSQDLDQRLFGHFGILAAYLGTLHPQHVVVVSPPGGSSPGELESILRETSLPGAICQIVHNVNAADGKSPVGGMPTAYICIGPQCSPPITAPEAFRPALEQARRMTIL